MKTFKIFVEFVHLMTDGPVLSCLMGILSLHRFCPDCIPHTKGGFLNSGQLCVLPDTVPL